MDSFLYKELYELEKDHWWFVSKKRIVMEMIKQFIPNHKKILDAGCGAGLMLQELSKVGTVSGMDFSEEAIRYSSTIFNGELKQASLPENMPFSENNFDLIVALDVLEHIEDDLNSLKELRKTLKKNGKLLITVPAFQFLWSHHDDVHQHKRRYSKKELLVKLRSAGFQIELISYYNTILFPLILTIRFLFRILKIKSNSDAKVTSKTVNEILKFIFSLEKKFLPFMRFPFGVSLICIVSKKN